MKHRTETRSNATHRSTLSTTAEVFSAAVTVACHVLDIRSKLCALNTYESRMNAERYIREEERTPRGKTITSERRKGENARRGIRRRHSSFTLIKNVLFRRSQDLSGFLIRRVHRNSTDRNEIVLRLLENADGDTSARSALMRIV